MSGDANEKTPAKELDTENAPAFLTTRDCFERMATALFFLGAGLFGSVVSGQIAPLFMFASAWSQMITSSILLYHVRRGKRLINPSSLPPEEQSICPTRLFTDRIDALTTTGIALGLEAWIFTDVWRQGTTKSAIFFLILSTPMAFVVSLMWRRSRKNLRRAAALNIPWRERMAQTSPVTAQQTEATPQKRWWTASVPHEEITAIKR